MWSVLKTTMKTQLKDRFREMGVFKNEHMQGPAQMGILRSILSDGLILMIRTDEGAAVSLNFLQPQQNNQNNPMKILVSVLVIVYAVCLVIALCAINSFMPRAASSAPEGPIINIKAQTIK